MAIPWNEDDPRDAAVIVHNLTYVLEEIAQQASLRRPPTVALAQEWHRRIYDGVRLPVRYYAGEVRDSDPRFPELFGYEVSVGRQRGSESSRVPQLLASFEAAMEKAVAALDPRLKPRPEGSLYATAAALSMRGEHQAMVGDSVQHPGARSI